NFLEGKQMRIWIYPVNGNKKKARFLGLFLFMGLPIFLHDFCKYIGRTWWSIGYGISTCFNGLKYTLFCRTSSGYYGQFLSKFLTDFSNYIWSISSTRNV